jgi:hypothetical protein
MDNFTLIVHLQFEGVVRMGDASERHDGPFTGWAIGSVFSYVLYLQCLMFLDYWTVVPFSCTSHPVFVLFHLICKQRWCKKLDWDVLQKG